MNSSHNTSPNLTVLMKKKIWIQNDCKIFACWFFEHKFFLHTKSPTSSYICVTCNVWYLSMCSLEFWIFNKIKADPSATSIHGIGVGITIIVRKLSTQSKKKNSQDKIQKGTQSGDIRLFVLCILAFVFSLSLFCVFAKPPFTSIRTVWWSLYEEGTHNNCISFIVVGFFLVAMAFELYERSDAKIFFSFTFNLTGNLVA